MRRLNAYHIGRIRIAAAKILSKNLGFAVYPEQISPATGRNRSDWRMDVYRWELFTHNGRLPVVVGSWDRLTDFVRRAKLEGCHIDDGEVVIGGKND